MSELYASLSLQRFGKAFFDAYVMGVILDFIKHVFVVVKISEINELLKFLDQVFCG